MINLTKKIAELPRHVWSSAGLNLVCTIEQKSSEIIRGIPDALEAWNSNCSGSGDDDKNAVTKLERICEEVSLGNSSVTNGSKDHMSLIKLLADTQNYYGKYKAASKSIRRAGAMLSCEEDRSKERITLLLAQAKAEFNSGDFRESSRLGKEAQCMASYKDGPLVEGCSLMAVALSDLMIYLQQYDYGDPDEELRIIESINDVVLSLQRSTNANRSPQAILATCSAMHNLCIATFALLHSNSNNQNNLSSSNNNHIRIPNKISDTLDYLTSHSYIYENHPYYQHLGHNLLASIYCTSAFYNLFHTNTIIKEGHLKAASKASQEALHICEAFERDGNLYYYDPLIKSKSLFLLGTCFANKAHSAIKSEELFTSSIVMLEQQPVFSSPFSLLSLRDAYIANAKMYDDCDDGRDNEAEKLRLLADDLEESTMVKSWRYKPGILSGLWFFTCSDFQL